MNKKTTEKRTRGKKKENPLSASSETTPQVYYGIDVKSLIHFFKPFKCKNKTQKDLLSIINKKDLIIASGPAGVGKSYVTVARALELLKENPTQYKKIIISKPAVEADEHHGFIPGSLREKMEPYVASTLDIIDELIGKQNRLTLEEQEIIQIQPLAFIRGKSINNTILIMEEAQNMTPKQMKTLLTRIGYDSKFIISGDLDQSDKFKNITESGLYDAIKRHKNVEEIGFIEFSEEEIVRNPIISKILANYKPKTPPPPAPPKSRLIPDVKIPTRSETKLEKIGLFQKFLNLFK
jgi:phosphate starvation-inducible PhoH-like protein